MSFRTTGIAMLGAMALTASAAAQTPQKRWLRLFGQHFRFAKWNSCRV